jgi:hypothetical protein
MIERLRQSLSTVRDIHDRQPGIATAILVEVFQELRTI